MPHNKNSGCKVANKTSFKKGAMPHNSAKVGDEVTTKDGYIRVKVANPSQWALKHVLAWESANGPMPKSSVVWFKDQDKENCELSNLEVITRSEQVRRNKLKMTSFPIELQEAVGLVARLQNRASNKMKLEKGCS